MCQHVVAYAAAAAAAAADSPDTACRWQMHSGYVLRVCCDYVRLSTISSAGECLCDARCIIKYGAPTSGLQYDLHLVIDEAARAAPLEFHEREFLIVPTNASLLVLVFVNPADAL